MVVDDVDMHARMLRVKGCCSSGGDVDDERARGIQMQRQKEIEEAEEEERKRAQEQKEAARK